MLGAVRSALTTPDLRKKILFTLGIVAVYRLGATLPAPGVSYSNVQECLRQVQGSDAASVYSLINLFSGGALLQLSIFALGIMPYITASIIVQLLTVVIPRFEQLKKEGQSGQGKLTQYTRYLTIALAVLQSTGIVALADRDQLFQDCDPSQFPILPGADVFDLAVIVIVMTAGTAVIMWFGELVTERGVGNGMSLLIFSLDRGPHPGRGRQHPRELRWHRLRRRLRVRPGHHRERRVRRAGPAAHPRAVRQADGRAPDVRRHVDLPAAEGQPGRRHPGDLRVVAALPARPALADHGQPGLGLLPVRADATWPTSPTGCTSCCTSP